VFSLKCGSELAVAEFTATRRAYLGLVAATK